MTTEEPLYIHVDIDGRLVILEGPPKELEERLKNIRREVAEPPKPRIQYEKPYPRPALPLKQRRKILARKLRRK